MTRKRINKVDVAECLCLLYKMRPTDPETKVSENNFRVDCKKDVGQNN